jgi:hypothetical protein
MKLSLNSRPIVLFDPSKKEHRAYYSSFLKTKSWSQCPVRFVVSDARSSENVAAVMQRQLVEHFIMKEFKTAEVA